MTVQLQRLLQPTPTVDATPEQHRAEEQQSAAVIATPSRPLTPIIVPATPSPYTIDQFLQQSGLPPSLSRTATSAVFTVLSWFLAIVDVIVGAIVSRFQAWWHNVISRNFPNTADIIEALLEYTVEVCQFLIKAAKFTSPYVVWLVQTLIATLLFIGGSFVCGIIILSKGRDAAQSSGAGEVQSSAMKSLNESIQNSPFYSRKAVPFTPRFVMASDRVDAAAASTVVVDAGDDSSTTTFKSPPLTNTIPPKPSASKSTPPVSVMKRHSSFQSNPNTPNNVAKPTPKTRRVLFSESQHGQVDTEQFFYDKTMPSARKLPRPNENRQQQVIVVADATQTTTADTSNDTSPTNNSASNTPVLRPSKFGASGTTDNKIQQQQSVQSQVTTVNQPSTAVKNQQAQQDEQSKQQYIEKYGLLPSITPLSKRYSRMKRQQGQSFAIAKPSSKNVTVSTGNNGNNNVVKRKRRDLISAASRMGRRRLNNHRAGGSSLPVVLLGKNRTPMKRRREDGLNRADEWVWRAMNSDGEKENLDSQGGGVTKRTKFGNDVPAPALLPGLSTPPKSAKKASPSITTPPKTPGPSTFSLGSSTPAPKSNKNSDAGATPAKTPLSSFGFNDASSSSSVGFSFGNNASSSGGNAVDTPSVAAVATKPDEKEVSGSSFSFGDTAATSFTFGDTASKSNDATPSASLTFGAPSAVKPTSGTASATAPTENQGSDKSQAFSFGATSTPVPNSAQDITAKASFSFGSVGQPNTPATSASTSNETKQTPSFSFGGASAATPSSSFAFGATNQTPSQAPPAAAAPSDPKQAPSFAFGGAQQSSGFAAPVPSGPPSFSFGGAAVATPSSGLAAPAAAAPIETKPPSFAFGNSGVTAPASTFSFGSSNQPPAAAPVLGGAPAPPTFAFGGQAPGPGIASNPSSFSLGGSASGASARRRARSGRRK